LYYNPIKQEKIYHDICGYSLLPALFSISLMFLLEIAKIIWYYV